MLAATRMRSYLIAAEGNPLVNIAALQDVLLVMSDGHIIVNRLDFAMGGQ